jgi:Ni,Fe-hydrogenase III small subunit
MNEKQVALKIYNLSHPLMNTEMFSIQGDKYVRSLPFEWQIVNDMASADIIVWDGVITPKNQDVIKPLLESFKTSKVLLLLGESMTLFKNHPMVQLVELSDLRYVELAGWSVLPEEILSAFDQCREKLKNV